MDKLPTEQKPDAAIYPPRTFSEAEFLADADMVVAYAAATGRVVVEDEDGRPLFVISIPIVDLPTLER
ncbi:MAG TPA: hypothetical protein VH165_22670 [Kofleriaceae bacterium]|jgi:hypothetical protein|nr:hypothetical protein [Kofleriaceae bacterium]